jgi:hypothetical protein
MRDLANTIAELPGIKIVLGVWMVIVLFLVFGEPEDEED